MRAWARARIAPQASVVKRFADQPLRRYEHRPRFRIELIDRVILALEDGQLAIEMRGDLAATLAFSANKKEVAAARGDVLVQDCGTRAAGSPAAAPPHKRRPTKEPSLTTSRRAELWPEIANCGGGGHHISSRLTAKERT